MIKTPLSALSRVIYDFSEALKNYEKFSERELHSFLIEIEDIVDAILSQHKMKSITDARFKAFQDAMREYETTIKAIKEAMMDKDYNRVRALLPELEMTVRRINRLMSVIATGSVTQVVDMAKEFEIYIGESLHEYDERIKDLSHTARLILAYLVDSPLREMNLKEIPKKLGMTEKESGKVVSDAVGELIRKVPDLVEVVPDTKLGGLKIRLKR